MDSGIEKPCSATKNGLTTLRLITGEVVEVKIPRDRKQLKTLRKDLKRGFSLSNSVDLDDPIFLGFRGQVMTRGQTNYITQELWTPRSVAQTISFEGGDLPIRPPS